jgi:AcrR family transcriptional regulator
METEHAAPRRREEYTEATRQALLAAGLESFVTHGYQASGIEAISRAARVTRGAFYHHYADKKALFEAVVIQLQAGAAERIQARARTHKKVWDRMRAGIDAYLDVCLEPAYGRLVVQEAPVVLGTERYREIEEQYTFALLQATLTALKERGELAVDNVALLSRMVDAMVCETALMLTSGKPPARLRAQAQEIIGRLLDGFRRPPASS